MRCACRRSRNSSSAIRASSRRPPRRGAQRPAQLRSPARCPRVKLLEATDLRAANSSEATLASGRRARARARRRLGRSRRRLSAGERPPRPGPRSAARRPPRPPPGARSRDPGDDVAPAPSEANALRNSETWTGGSCGARRRCRPTGHRSARQRRPCGCAQRGIASTPRSLLLLSVTTGRRRAHRRAETQISTANAPLLSDRTPRAAARSTSSIAASSQRPDRRCSPVYSRESSTAPYPPALRSIRAASDRQQEEWRLASNTGRMISTFSATSLAVSRAQLPISMQSSSERLPESWHQGLPRQRVSAPLVQLPRKPNHTYPPHNPSIYIKHTPTP